ncbi:MAG: efflux RND transporter periplasmic adaptor subunit [Gammaproteobacteria bacterium]|nr:efflux RND transporter periplasmic adaptor subunit [Gammaproteobacteria bacterium]
MVTSHRRSPAAARAPVLVGTLIALGALAACEQPAVEEAPVVRPVKIQTVGEVDASARREYPGSIRALQNAEVAFEVPGRIIEFFVAQGEPVVQGELIARLDPRDYEADLKASQANLRKAESDLARSLGIYKEEPGAISKETIDSHRRAVDVARANLEVAEKAVEDTRLRAPFSGLLARKLVEDYQNVQAKEPIVIVQDSSTLQIEINVPERDVAQGKTIYKLDSISGEFQPEVIVSALPDRVFPAEVVELATAADPVTRTFLVKLEFDNPDDVLILPGMTARVRVTVNPELAYALPVGAALADSEGRAFVWKVNAADMTVSKTPIELGNMLDSRVMVKDGVDEGDMIAVSGVHQLRDGMKVRRLQ